MKETHATPATEEKMIVGSVDYQTGRCEYKHPNDSRPFIHILEHPVIPKTVAISSPWFKESDGIRDDGNGNLYIVKEQHD